MFRRTKTAVLASALLLVGTGITAEVHSDSIDDGSAYSLIPFFGGPGAVGADLRPGDGISDPSYRLGRNNLGLETWYEKKEKLASSVGLAVGMDYQSLLLASNADIGKSNASGGIFRVYGSWTLTGKDSGNTGTLVAKAENRHRYSSVAPQNYGFNTGALAIPGTQFSDYDWGLTNLFWQQRFAKGRATIVAGQVDATDYLDVYGLINPLTAFSNLAFSTNPSIAAPNQGFGAAIGGFMTDNVYVVGGFSDANAEASDPGFELFDEGETFKHLEIGYVSSQERRYFDNIHLTLWQVDERDSAGVAEDYGIALSAAWLFDNAWMPFLKAGTSEGKAALVRHSVSAGIGYLFRSRDLAAIGLNWSRPAGSNAENQYISEIFYRVQLSEGIAITPSAQLIANPINNPQDDLITLLGLRLRFAL